MSIRNELAQIVDDVAEQATREGRIASPLDVVDAILARYAVVGLPEPVRCDDDLAEDLKDPFEFRGPWGTYFVDHRGNVGSDTGPHWSPADARTEAAALLAAANRAEAQS